MNLLKIKVFTTKMCFFFHFLILIKSFLNDFMYKMKKDKYKLINEKFHLWTLFL